MNLKKLIIFKRPITFGIWWLVTGIIISIALIPVAILYSVGVGISTFLSSTLGIISMVILFPLYILAVLTVAGLVAIKLGWKRRK